MTFIPIPFGKPDERFMIHRLKSTSLAGVIGAVLAVGLFAYHYYGNGIWRWDLFAVAATMAAVKLAAMAWYRIKD
ncbi:MAG: hypothetical protein LJE93_05655 [Acidobacteria bacterium]|jgi:hypothetical protein|nr:hypothetical protein [Acidobacteriota bacterium]